MTATDWRWLQESVGAGARPIHAFHVLEVYPRTGLLRGGEAPIVATMDACRIRWGTLVSVHGVLRLGPAQPETVTGWWDESGLLGGAQPGDPLSLHWGWACDRLSPSQLDRLVTWTGVALALANQFL